QVNFGLPGVVIGFFILGWTLGFLDVRAAIAESRGDLPRAIVFFLPAVALIQPNGSMVELVGGAAAALVAAYPWTWVWRHWVVLRRPTHPRPWVPRYAAAPGLQDPPG